MRVSHDLTLFNLAILLEEADDLGLLQARVNAGDEEVGSRVDGTVLAVIAIIVFRAGTGAIVGQQYCQEQ